MAWYTRVPGGPGVDWGSTRDGGVASVGKKPLDKTVRMVPGPNEEEISTEQRKGLERLAAALAHLSSPGASEASAEDADTVCEATAPCAGSSVSSLSARGLDGWSANCPVSLSSSRRIRRSSSFHCWRCSAICRFCWASVSAISAARLRTASSSDSRTARSCSRSCRCRSTWRNFSCRSSSGLAAAGGLSA